MREGEELKSGAEFSLVYNLSVGFNMNNKDSSHYLMDAGSSKKVQISKLTEILLNAAPVIRSRPLLLPREQVGLKSIIMHALS